MFITLEGPEGSGKTSQLPRLADYLREQGYDVLTTREPGGTIIGDQVRAVLTRLDNTAMQPRTEILLFLAARAQLVEESSARRWRRAKSSSQTATPTLPWPIRVTGMALIWRCSACCSTLPPAACAPT